MDCIARRIRHNWFFLAVATSLLAAVLLPGPGSAFYHKNSYAVVVCLFLVIGASLSLEDMRSALAAVQVHILCQSLSLIASPLAFYCLLYRNGAASWLLGSHAAAKGMLVVSATPTTTSTGIMFTERAGGCVGTAAINAALGNLLGPIVSPIVTGVLLLDSSHQTAAAVPSPRKLALLCALILLPLLTGLGVQSIVRRALGETAAAKLRNRAAATMRAPCARSLRSIPPCSQPTETSEPHGL